MKNNLEEQFKKSLENYEVPYDASAWSDLSAKLDNRFPKKVKLNSWKWISVGSIVALTGAALIFLLPKSVSTDDSKVSEIEKETNPEKKVSNGINTTEENTINTNTEQKNQQNDVNKSFENIALENTSFDNAPSIAEEKSTIEENEVVSNKIVNNELNISDQKENNIKSSPTIGQPKKLQIQDLQDVCVGDAIEINNSNDVQLILEDALGHQTIIASNSKIEFTVANEGKHILYEPESNKSQTFTVKHVPKADIVITDQNLFENGLPTVKLSTNSSSSNLEWQFQNLPNQSGVKEPVIHYYNKGTYTITLTVTGANGCKSNETTAVHVSDDYNLLAVTAFDPLSNDIRKNTFLPFALTQRQVDFSMIVIDPSDGAVIFESDDVSNPWKGIDKRNGQMVEPNKAYIWRVILRNPEPGEKSEYKGTIVRM